MARLRFKYDDRGLVAKIRHLDAKLNMEIAAAIQYYAIRGMGEMKSNAPWTDRTGAARSGLHTVAESAGKRHSITFAHAVHYGIWLEVKYSGRDAIIMPTVVQIGDELLSSMRGMMRRI